MFRVGLETQKGRQLPSAGCPKLCDEPSPQTTMSNFPSCRGGVIFAGALWVIPGGPCDQPPYPVAPWLACARLAPRRSLRCCAGQRTLEGWSSHTPWFGLSSLCGSFQCTSPDFFWPIHSGKRIPKKGLAMQKRCCFVVSLWFPLKTTTAKAHPLPL